MESIASSLAPIATPVLVSASPGVAWVAVGVPFDVIRARLQVSSEYRGIWHCLSSTVKREGIRALWKGSVPHGAVCIPYSTLVFGTYSYFKPRSPSARHGLQSPSSAYPNKDATANTFRRVQPLVVSTSRDGPSGPGVVCDQATGVFTAGCASGVLISFIQNPLDVYRTRLQVSRSAADTAAVQLVLSKPPQMLRQLYRGMCLTSLRNIPGNGLYFLQYESLRHFFSRSPSLQRLNTSVQALVCGSITGLTVAVIFYPAEVIRTRMQVSAPTAGGIVATMQGISRDFGMYGFARGLPVAMAKAFAVNGAGFALLTVITGS